MKIHKKISMSHPEDVVKYIMPKLRHLDHEEFWVYCVTSKNKLISKEMISKGSLDGAVVHPREVFKYAILQSAAAIVVAHNHPSGEPEPSTKDNKLTEILKQSGEIIGIPVLDHLIIGDGVYYSYLEEGALK